MPAPPPAAPPFPPDAAPLPPPALPPPPPVPPPPPQSPPVPPSPWSPAPAHKDCAGSTAPPADNADATGRWCSTRCPGCAVKLFNTSQSSGTWQPSDEGIAGCVCAVVGDGVVLQNIMQVNLSDADDCFVVVGSGRAYFWGGGGGGLFAGGGEDLMCGGDSFDRRFFGAPYCPPRRVRAALCLCL